MLVTRRLLKDASIFANLALDPANERKSPYLCQCVFGRASAQRKSPNQQGGDELVKCLLHERYQI